MTATRVYPTQEAAQTAADQMMGWPTPAVLPMCEYEPDDEYFPDGHERNNPKRCWLPGICYGYVIRVHKGRTVGPNSWTASEYVLEDDRVGMPG